MFSFYFRKYEIEISELKKKVQGLEAANGLLQRQMKEITDKYKCMLKKVFTPGQIKKLVQEERRLRWSSEDIASLCKEKNIFKKLAENTMVRIKSNNSIPYEVILYFARVRSYIRLRDLNRKISFQNTKEN